MKITIDKLNKKIIERKKAEKELRRSEQRWRALVKNSPDIILNVARDGTILFINRTSHIPGLTPEKAIGRSVYDYTSPEDHDIIKKSIERVFKTGESDSFESGGPGPDGTVSWYVCRLAPVKLDGDSIYGNLILTDITRRKKAEEQLREAMEIKSEFTSMVSHELRTPLTAIKEGIAIVLDGSSGKINDKQKDFLDIAKRNVDRLARLINDVLDFQKFEAGRMEFNIQENDINAVVNEVRKVMSPLAEEKGLDLVVKPDDKLPEVRFDRDRIIQVLTNIVNNAIKFTEKGSVSITTNKEGDTIHVAVKDTGHGIKEEDILRLFQRFEQLTKGKGRKTGGTGLGLAISKEIIERHNGKIWVESEFGKGTTFHFVLPIKKGERNGFKDSN